MENEAWPEPHAPAREPLPRVEELPVAEHGYERESVKAAFDAFYRHAAQLDAALRTLEAVDSFHRQAAALRADLRALRAAGWTQQPSLGGQPGYSYNVRAPREGVPPAVWRIAGEVLLLIGVAVALGVAKVSWWVIVAAMAGAFLIVCLIEWLAGRGQPSYAEPASPASTHPVVEARPGEATDEHDSLGWTAFEEAQAPSDAMTIIGAPPRDAEPDAEIEGAEQEPVAAAEPEPEATPEPTPEEDAEPEREKPELPPAASEPELEPGKSHWWQRKRQAESSEPEAEAPAEVHLLTASADGPPEEQTAEGLEVEEPAPRRFRRR